MTDKVTLGNITTFQSDASAVTQYNANNAAITAAMDNTLSLNGQAPNQMQATFDMNSNREINLPNPISVTEPVTLGYLNGVLAGNPLISGLIQGVPVSAAMQPVVNASTIANADTLLGISTAMQPVVGAATTSAAAVDLGISTSIQPALSSTIANAQTTLGIQPLAIPGAVEMRFINSAWTVIKPDGTQLSTVGTTTSGLQEAINYASTNGWPLYVQGPSLTTGTAGTLLADIVCTTAIAITGMTGWYMQIRGAHITFPPGATPNGNGAFIQISTVAECTFDWDCSILCQASCTHILMFVGAGPIGESFNPFIENNYFHFREIISGGGSQTDCVCFIPNPDSINNNIFKFELIDSGTFATSGIVVNTAGPLATFPNCGFVQNIFDIGLVGGSRVIEVQIDLPATGGPTGANIWRFGGITPSVSGMVAALQTGATFDTYHIGSISINAGTCQNGIQFVTGSTQNIVICGQCFATTNDILDAGTQNTYMVNGTRANIPIAVFGGQFYTNVANFMHRTKTSWTNGAGSSTGTLTNAPAATNPTKWIPVDDNGTTRFIPAW